MSLIWLFVPESCTAGSFERVERISHMGHQTLLQQITHWIKIKDLKL